MNRHTLGLFGQTLGLMAIALVFLVGVGPIMESLYAHGLWPKPSVSDVEGHLRHRAPEGTVTCYEGKDGWEFICDVVHHPRGAAPSHHKYGVMGSPFGTIGALSILPPDEPPPPRDVHLQQARARHQQAMEEQKRRAATIDLNTARVDQLRTLPGVDDALAHRIAIAVIHRRFKRVDDLLTVKGVDRAMLERIRPFVRVD